MIRIVSVDAMRALAIIFMILCHSVIYLSPNDMGFAWVHAFGNHIVGDFAAPIFLFLVGLSQAFSLHRTSAPRCIGAGARRRMLRRGTAVFAIGLAFAASAWGPARMFDWDVLTLIGFSIGVLALLRNAPGWMLVGVACGLVFASPALRDISGYAHFWGDEWAEIPGFEELFSGFILDPTKEYEASFTFENLLKGFFVNGMFPVFPWLAFPLIGYVVGRGAFAGVQKTAPRVHVGCGVALMSGGLIMAYAARHLGQRDVTSAMIAPLSFYPNTVSMSALQLGLCMVLFGLFRHAFDGRRARLPEFLTTHMELLSRFALTIYALHHLALLWPLWIMGRFVGDTERFYASAVTPPVGLAIGVALIILFCLIVPHWARRDAKYSLEWILGKLAG